MDGVEGYFPEQEALITVNEQLGLYLSPSTIGRMAIEASSHRIKVQRDLERLKGVIEEMAQHIETEILLTFSEEMVRELGLRRVNEISKC